MENNLDNNIIEGGSSPTSDGKQDKSLSNEQPVNMTREIIDWLLHIVGAVGIALLIVKFVAQVTVVIGSSMEPTLHDHNRLMMEKLTPRFGTLSRGDIVVLEAEKELVDHGSSADRSPLIKRVIGVEGDTVRVSNGKVYLNGQELKEDYINGNVTYISKPKEEKVPQGHIFVMGDNRPEGGSIDSRILGTFNKDKVLGRVMFRLYPFDEFGGLNK